MPAGMIDVTRSSVRTYAFTRRALRVMGRVRCDGRLLRGVWSGRGCGCLVDLFTRSKAVVPGSGGKGGLRVRNLPTLLVPLQNGPGQLHLRKSGTAET
jgi:hypothetical protein